MKRSVVVLFLLWSACANSQDTVIRILGIALDGADLEVAQQQLDLVSFYWLTSSGTTIQLANGGALWLEATDGDGNIDTVWQQAILDAITVGDARDQHQADIILFFGGEFNGTTIYGIPVAGPCGKADQENWIDYTSAPHGFVGDPQNFNLDLRGADDYYTAIVGTTGAGCSNKLATALHELGHLHGAGHQLGIGQNGIFLYTDSHATAWFDWDTYQLNYSIMWQAPPKPSVYLYSWS